MNRFHRLAPLMLMGALLSSCNSPESLVGVIKMRPAEFPKSHYILMPPGSGTCLGFVPKDRELPLQPKGSRLGSTADAPCFLVSPITEKGLESVSIVYKSGASLKAELGVGPLKDATISQDASGTLVLMNISIRKGVGPLDPNSICQDPGTSNIRVFTREIVAGEVELTFSKGVSFSLDIKVPKTGGLVNLAPGWHMDKSGLIKGKNIVLTGELSEYEVSTSSNGPVTLPKSPANTGVDLPSGLEGKLVVKRLSLPGTPTMTVKLLATSSQVPTSPPGLNAKPLGQDVVIPKEDRCYFLLASGSMISFSWTTKITPEGERAVVELKSFRVRMPTL